MTARKLAKHELVERLAANTVREHPAIYRGHEGDARTYWRGQAPTVRDLAFAAKNHGLISDAEFQAFDPWGEKKRAAAARPPERCALCRHTERHDRKAGCLHFDGKKFCNCKGSL